MLKKIKLEKHFTKSNPFVIIFLKIDYKEVPQFSNNITTLEPFAGNEDIINLLK